MTRTTSALTAIAAFTGLAVTASAASAATCALLSPMTYDVFVSCTVPGGQDSFATVNNIVTGLFGDAITLNLGGSYASQGGGVAGGAFENGSRPDLGFVLDSVSRKTITLSALPDQTLFVSIKQGHGFELFGLSGLTPNYVFTHSLNGNGYSHISTYAGTMTSEVPLPAPGILLAGAMFGVAALRKFRTARRAA